MSTAHIATIHFHPVKVDRRQFGFGVYELPVVPAGDKPFILTITDKVQIERGPYQESSNRKVRSIRRHPETGQVIANDIVNSATRQGIGMTHDCHPGIWVVRESMPVIWEQDIIDEGGHLLHSKGQIQTDAEGTAIWREASEEEKTAMWAEDLAANIAADASYAEWLIQQANAMDERQWAKGITAVTKAAAAHYKITTDWNTKAGALQRVPCPHCKEQVMKGAVRCRHCSQIIDPEAAALLEARQENSMLKAKRIQDGQEKARQLEEKLAKEKQTVAA